MIESNKREAFAYQDSGVQTALKDLSQGVNNTNFATLLTAEALAMMDRKPEEKAYGFGIRSNKEVRTQLETWAQRFATDSFEDVTPKDYGFLSSYLMETQRMVGEAVPEAAKNIRDWWRQDALHPWTKAHKDRIADTFKKGLDL